MAVKSGIAFCLVVALLIAVPLIVIPTLYPQSCAVIEIELKAQLDATAKELEAAKNADRRSKCSSYQHRLDTLKEISRHSQQCGIPQLSPSPRARWSFGTAELQSYEELVKDQCS